MENKYTILYLCKNDPSRNDDEGAIEYALTKLGHSVIRMDQDSRKRKIKNSITKSVKADFCLVHKYPRPHELSSISKDIPCFYWHFDLVHNYPDRTLKSRLNLRRNSVKQMLNYCTSGFHTDGTWVEEYNNNPRNKKKLISLKQGTDERYVGIGDSKLELPSILFFGHIYHGSDRDKHIKKLHQEFGDNFKEIGYSGDNVHKRQLANYVASCDIVVAPCNPVTSKYWSNRVYLMGGFGACIIHPKCEELLEHYTDYEVAYYTTPSNSITLINDLLVNPDIVNSFRKNIYKRTVDNHLYRHRCKELVDHIETFLN